MIRTVLLLGTVLTILGGVASDSVDLDNVCVNNSFSDNSDRDKTLHTCTKLCEKTDKCEIRIAIILPCNDTLTVASLSEVKPLLNRAINYAYDNGILERWVGVKLLAKDDRCDAAYAQKAIIEYYMMNPTNCIHAIFGPFCDYSLATVSRIVKFFKTPLLTAGGFSHDFDKGKTKFEDEYYMLVRTGILVSRGLSQFFRRITERYGWRKVAFLYEKEGQHEVAGENTCSLMMQTLARELSTIHGFQYKDGDLGLSTFDIHDFLRKDIGVNYGIIVMCTSEERVREILVAAASLDRMVYDGEYLFFNIDLLNRAQNRSRPWIRGKNYEEIEKLKNAYKSVVTLTTSAQDTQFDIQATANLSSGFYDAMLLYLNVVGNYIKRDKRNTTLHGEQLVHDMMNFTFIGLNGREVQVNANGDRITNYSLLSYNPEDRRFRVVANYKQNDANFTFSGRIHWPSGEAPLDTPLCGYNHSKCPVSIPYYVPIGGSVFIILVLLFVCIWLYRIIKLQREIQAMSWKVNWSDVARKEITSDNYLRSGSKLTLYSLQQSSEEEVGYFKNNKVFIKDISPRKTENLTRDQLVRLKQVLDIQHGHLVKFYGACLDPKRYCVLLEYCQKGSLEEMLTREVTLDIMIRKSFIQDLIQGMHYLHNTEIKSHGALSSSNCVLDGRLVLKITNFGVRFLYKNEENEKDTNYWKKKLWVAPELLRMSDPPDTGTQKGDVYSFGIIMHEIMYRQGPFYLDYKKDYKDIVESVKNGVHGEPLRPVIDNATAKDDLASLMKRCWAEDLQDRPDFPALKGIIQKLNKEHDNGCILDNLLSRMEQYANNLESLVQERTEDYLEEKKKCENLLYQLLPKSVAKQLIMGQSVVAETYDQVTIYFSDIVDFTSLSANSTPLQVVDFLNDLYTCFDSTVEHFDVYKVETIGDSYMVVSGLPVRNGNLHAPEIARMALALLENVRTFSIRHLPDEKLKIRIGMHTGPCVAGVVGLKMPRYCLFGDTVNTASRMESNGKSLRIQISRSTKEVLDTFGTFELEYRGVLEVKGKGKMETYWLNGEKPVICVASAVPKASSAVTTSSTITRTVPSTRGNADVNVRSSPTTQKVTGTSTVCFKNQVYSRQSIADDSSNASATTPLLSVTSVADVDKDSYA